MRSLGTRGRYAEMQLLMQLQIYMTDDRRSVRCWILGIASLPKAADCISDYGGHVLGSSVQFDLVTI